MGGVAVNHGGGGRARTRRCAGEREPAAPRPGARARTRARAAPRAQVSRGLPPAAALEQTVEEMRAAGGSFKAMRARAAAAAAGEREGGGERVLQLKSMPLALGFEFCCEGLDA